MTCVLSYTRFSSKRQAKGQSYQRQTKAALDWCELNGFALDDRWCFHDPGVSAWSGENAKKGELSVLLQLVRDGEIPRGSILLIEAMDRLTRANLVPAVMLLSELLTAGIEIVTLQDGGKKRLTEKSAQNPFEFMTAIVALSTGNIESSRKSDMVRKAYAANRNAGKSQIFGSAPGWLWRKDKYSPWQLDEAKAESVRKVFALCIEGYGASEIARRANAEGWVVPTRLGNKKRGGGWPITMPSKLIRNRAVVGEHQHRNRTHEAHDKHWMGESRGEPIKDYYPAVVSEEVFFAAQAATTRRRKPQRRDEWYLNIWSGLLVCGKCGGGMHRKTDSKARNQGQVRCRNAGAGLCDTPSMAIDAFDAVLLSLIEDFGKGLHLEGSEDYTRLIDTETGVLATLNEAEARLGSILEENGDNLPILRAKANEIAENRIKVIERIEAHRQAQAEQALRLVNSSFTDDLLPCLYLRSAEAKEVRAKVNAKLRRLIDKIVVVGGKEATVHYKVDSTTQFIDLSQMLGLFSMPAPEIKYHTPSSIDASYEALRLIDLYKQTLETSIKTMPGECANCGLASE